MLSIWEHTHFLMIFSVLPVLLKTFQPIHLRKHIFSMSKDLFSWRKNVLALSLDKSMSLRLKYLAALKTSPEEFLSS